MSVLANLCGDLLDLILRSKTNEAKRIYDQEAASLDRLFVEDESVVKRNIVLNKNTAILTFPERKNEVFSLLKNEIFGGESIRYDDELNLAIMGGGGAHRLAALSLWLRGDGERFYEFKRNHLRFVKINIDLLRSYRFRKSMLSKRKVILFDPSNEVRYKITIEIFEVIALLQKIYLEEVNVIGFIEAMVLECRYLCRKSTEHEKMSAKLKKYK